MSKQEKIVISGVPSKWSDDEFNERLAVQVHKYRGTRDCMIQVHHALEHEYLQSVHDYMSNGYTLARAWFPSHGADGHSTWLVKPESLQEGDIEVLKKTLKDEYVNFLQQERAKYQDMLREQLKQKQQEKDEKAEQAKRDKILADIESQVQNCWSPLLIPEDI